MSAILTIPGLFSPSLRADDPLAAYWLRYVTLALRREICWLWRERASGEGPSAGRNGSALPPYTDRLQESLDLSRYAAEKNRFFAEDETAAYLSGLLDEAVPLNHRAPTQGSFSWVVWELSLSPMDCFILALGLHAVVDSAAGQVYAACQNDALRQLPTMALAQRLWRDPEEILSLANPAHPLFAHGILINTSSAQPLSWEAALQVHPLVAEGS
jgi:hypothetical protein